MAIQQAFEGEIEVTFEYKASEYSPIVRIPIEPERISYFMIERKYENVNILPVVYLSLNVSADMYSKMISTYEYSMFYLKARKRNVLSVASLWTNILEDEFSYVTSTQTPDYAEGLATTQASKDNSYRNIMIGLVSVDMTNKLRKSFNGVYKDIKMSQLVNMALEGLPNLVMQDLEYDNYFQNCIITPLSSRYKMLNFLFEKEPFYNSNFTFFMDFNKTYLVSKNAIGVDGKDALPTNITIDIRGYTAEDAFNDGVSKDNGSYTVYVNAANTSVIIDNATEKMAQNIVAFSNETGTQDLTATVNTSSKTAANKMYIRNSNAAAVKNEMQSGSVMIKLLKQNVDTDLFNPNRIFNVKHYGEYSRYNGPYFLTYKRDFFYKKETNKFILTCNVGLKRAVQEEMAKTTKDTYKPAQLISSVSPSAKKKTTANKKYTSKVTKAKKR